MGCACKHNQQRIREDYLILLQLRELFIKRMTVDSDHNDRRRKDFNQALFRFETKEEVDVWNEECEKYGWAKKEYGNTVQCWIKIDLDMVMKCFDNAMKDMRRMYCDTESCRKGWL